MEVSDILRQFGLTEDSFPQGSRFVQASRFGNNALVVIVPKGTESEIPMNGFKSHVIKSIDGVDFEEKALPGQENIPEPLREYVYLRWQNY